MVYSYKLLLAATSTAFVLALTEKTDELRSKGQLSIGLTSRECREVADDVLNRMLQDADPEMVVDAVLSLPELLQVRVNAAAGGTTVMETCSKALRAQLHREVVLAARDNHLGQYWALVPSDFADAGERVFEMMLAEGRISATKAKEFRDAFAIYSENPNKQTFMGAAPAISEMLDGDTYAVEGVMSIEQRLLLEIWDFGLSSDDLHSRFVPSPTM